MPHLQRSEGQNPPVTPRGQAKAQRRADILTASATLFAERGFHNVSNEDIGAAVGVSGPAVYRHFSSKQAILGASLVEVSQDLLTGGQKVSAQYEDPAERLDSLIAFHVQFALTHPAVIVVQDREMPNLTEEDRREVRVLQRSYVTLWVDALRELAPSHDVTDLTLRAQAVFGLINSTPHSLRARRLRDPQSADQVDTGRITLEEMAGAALATAWMQPRKPTHLTSTGGTP